MKVQYNEEVDVLTIRLSSAAIDASDEVQPGVIFDYDNQGNTVGIEILDASKRVENPRSVSYDYTLVAPQEQELVLPA